MTKAGWTVFVLLILAIAGLVTGYLIMSQRAAVHPHGETATSTPNLAGQSIFTDGIDGFSIRFPQADATDYTFQTFYHLPANWRVDADVNGTGTPVIAIVGYRTQSDHAYPRYFDAEVRIGVSKDPKEIARCQLLAADHGETQMPDTVLNGTTFKTFAFESAGMMQYLKGVSYRAVHNGACVAIEKLETGASYRDDPVGPDTIPQATLDKAYASLDRIVSAFSFAS